MGPPGLLSRDRCYLAMAAETPAGSPRDARPPEHDVAQRCRVPVPDGVPGLSHDGARVFAERLGAKGQDVGDGRTVDAQVAQVPLWQPARKQRLAPPRRRLGPVFGSLPGRSEALDHLFGKRPKRAQLAAGHAEHAPRTAELCVVEDGVTAADRGFGAALHLLPATRFRGP